jgi:molecular chaperone DnaK (HSP70)
MAELPDFEDYSFVVAIDVGTSYTKVAWVKDLRNPSARVHCFDKWPKAKNTDRVPTAVVYQLCQKRELSSSPASWKYVAFGQDALKRFQCEGDLQCMALFRSFKMSLHEKENFGEEITITSSNIPTGLDHQVPYPALDIFASILQELSTLVLQHLKRTYSINNLHNRNIKWVLTVPALWKATARHFMRQAAEKVI